MISESDIGKKCQYWDAERKERRSGIVQNVLQQEVPKAQSYYPAVEQMTCEKTTVPAVTVRDQETGELQEVDWEFVTLSPR